MFRQGKELSTREFKVDKYDSKFTTRRERVTVGAYPAICHDVSNV